MYKQLVSGKKAVFFDLDGTLVETEPYWQLALEAIYKKEGGSETSFTKLVPSRGMPMLAKWRNILSSGYLSTTKTPAELTKETNELFVKMLDRAPLEVRDGFWQLAVNLKDDKGLKLGLTTNTQKDIAQKILAKIGVTKPFDMYVFGEDVKKPKPDPEMYLKAAKMLGITPKECLVFEDSPLGAKSAHKAGMDLIVIWDGETPQDNFPEETLLFLFSFEGLADNLDSTIQEAFGDFRARLQKHFNLQTQTQPR
jgi:HAD superfamily hydrolase (TIGR01509 family)